MRSVHILQMCFLHTLKNKGVVLIRYSELSLGICDHMHGPVSSSFWSCVLSRIYNVNGFNFGKKKKEIIT